MKQPHVVYKPWGKEVWLELNDRYCYKRIYINAGYQTSFQYHNHKIETNYIISGTAEVWLENNNGEIEKFMMKENDFFDVKPPKKHRVRAITDIILQEVSTPEVDDVIRIEDDTNRRDGRIDIEHIKPAVLVLAAGLGTRLGDLTKYTNKALIPIADRAAISYIIDQFPVDYDLVIATGYKADVVEEYCKLVYPIRNITFVYIPEYETTGPGHSALACKQYLQRPFYLTTADCIVNKGSVPILDGDWLAVNERHNSNQYSTVKASSGKVRAFKNKSDDAYMYAFCGLAGISDYKTFWNELENNYDGEVVSAFYNPQQYVDLQIRRINWIDTGNPEALKHTKNVLGDNNMSLHKNNGEIIYKEKNKFIKFIPDEHVVKNKNIRAQVLGDILPPNVVTNKYFVSYDWITGATLYTYDSFDIFRTFLKQFTQIATPTTVLSSEDITKFYYTKTQNRVNQFGRRFGVNYLSKSLTINNKTYYPFDVMFSKIEFDKFPTEFGYQMFHGDLQFDNVLYDGSKFYYLDWRDSFADRTDAGDLYYDLAKLYGGLLIPYNSMKHTNNIKLEETDGAINYNYSISRDLQKFTKEYETWLNDGGFDIQHVKLITALIFANMSPLHEEKFAKMLICKAVELLSEYN